MMKKQESNLGLVLRILCQAITLRREFSHEVSIIRIIIRMEFHS